MLLPFMDLICPLDGEALQLVESGNAWCCGQGHSFDIAKQGYVNLLPVQHKRSKDPGDSKAMVVARREFLNSGFYRPVALALNEVVLAEIAQHTEQRGSKNELSAEHTFTILDAGCGEGYYLREFLSCAGIETSRLAIAGLDISKWAVLAAAKQAALLQSSNGLTDHSSEPVRWIVGSNAHLPVANESIDCLLCVFGFPVPQEFLRVLKPNGCLIMVDPAANHLRELRNEIYAEVKVERERAISMDGFNSVANRHIQYPVQLSNQQQIQDLLSMTPHMYRASAAGKARVADLASLTVQVSVAIHLFRKRNDC